MRRVLVLLFAVIALAMTACQDLIDTDPSTSTPSSSSSPEPEGDDEKDDDDDSGEEPSDGAPVATGAEKTISARLTGQRRHLVRLVGVMAVPAMDAGWSPES
jgi:hypothetical protein